MEVPKKNMINDNGLYQDNINNIKNQDKDRLSCSISSSKEVAPISSNIKTNKKKNRCGVCKKKLGLLGFECRCSDTQFCAIHRLPESHDCSFDHQKFGRDNLSQGLVKVVADKFDNRI